MFGTMDDFERMIARAKELDIKIILDYVPNHCSDQHEWFKKSSDPNDPDYEIYKDYFIWNKGKLLENGTVAPPSNWLSVFRGSAWCVFTTIASTLNIFKLFNTKLYINQ